MKIVYEWLNKNIGKFGFCLTREETLARFHSYKVSLDSICEWLGKCKNDELRIRVAASLSEGSTFAQMQQDVIAQYICDIAVTPSRYYVEIGATNGVSISNTFMLEKSHSWSGILVEPAKRWHRDIIRNRTSKIDFRCVWSVSGKWLKFQEMEIGEFSTISSYASEEKSNYSGKSEVEYEVPTVSLIDLLKEHGAPHRIGFLSVDTEGSEYEILRNFDFKTYSFNFIAVEHNFEKSRGTIHDLLTQHGYSRVLTNLSKWDDWYVPLELANRFS